MIAAQTCRGDWERWLDDYAARPRAASSGGAAAQLRRAILRHHAVGDVETAVALLLVEQLGRFGRLDRAVEALVAAGTEDLGDPALATTPPPPHRPIRLAAGRG